MITNLSNKHTMFEAIFFDLKTLTIIIALTAIVSIPVFLFDHITGVVLIAVLSIICLIREISLKRFLMCYFYFRTIPPTKGEQQ